LIKPAAPPPTGRHFGGHALFSHQDEYGPVEVVEVGTVRNLHFGSSAIQSSLDTLHPDVLRLEYTQLMALALLFARKTSRILNIGLGAGAMVHFIQRQLPTAHIDTLELRPLVSQVAHEYFFLPLTPRHTIHHGDARDTITRQSHAYDIIFIDAFLSNGLSSGLGEQCFFSHCSERLAPGGLLAINLWLRDYPGVRQTVRLCQRYFKTLFLACDHARRNMILFASQSDRRTLQSRFARRQIIHPDIACTSGCEPLTLFNWSPNIKLLELKLQYFLLKLKK